MRISFNDTVILNFLHNYTSKTNVYKILSANIQLKQMYNTI